MDVNRVEPSLGLPFPNVPSDLGNATVTIGETTKPLGVSIADGDISVQGAGRADRLIFSNLSNEAVHIEITEATVLLTSHDYNLAALGMTREAARELLAECDGDCNIQGALWNRRESMTMRALGFENAAKYLVSDSFDTDALTENELSAVGNIDLAYSGFGGISAALARKEFVERRPDQTADQLLVDSFEDKHIIYESGQRPQLVETLDDLLRHQSISDAIKGEREVQINLRGYLEFEELEAVASTLSLSAAANGGLETLHLGSVAIGPPGKEPPPELGSGVFFGEEPRLIGSEQRDDSAVVVSTRTSEYQTGMLDKVRAILFGDDFPDRTGEELADELRGEILAEWQRLVREEPDATQLEAESLSNPRYEAILKTNRTFEQFTQIRVVIIIRDAHQGHAEIQIAALP